MQTFLPYPNFQESAYVLDNKRLGKQRVEVLQILRALNGETNGWVNHPAVKMWRGHQNYLVIYGMEICAEWIRRGFKDTCMEKIMKYFNAGINEQPPDWLGSNKFHYSHRCNLYRKKPEHYEKHFGVLPTNIPYLWPIEKEQYKTQW